MDSTKPIPTEQFRFRSQEQLLALANTNIQLPGELSAIRSTIKDGTHGAQLVMVTLRLDRAIIVCVSLFDGWLLHFITNWKAEPKILLVTAINPKIVGGEKLKTYLSYSFRTPLMQML